MGKIDWGFCFSAATIMDIWPHLDGLVALTIGTIMGTSLTDQDSFYFRTAIGTRRAGLTVNAKVFLAAAKRSVGFSIPTNGGTLMVNGLVQNTANGCAQSVGAV